MLVCITLHRMILWKLALRRLDLSPDGACKQSAANPIRFLVPDPDRGDHPAWEANRLKEGL